MRELKRPAGLGRDWVKNVRSKLISLLFLIGEYLLTSNPEKRRYLTYLNFRAPLIFAQVCAKINGSENRAQVSKINGSNQIRPRTMACDTEQA